MRVITQIPNNDLKQSQDVAKLAERAGFDGVVALENAHNPYIPLAVAAMATERIQLGTAVAMAFPRSPTITAHAAWDVQLASSGRFYLGLGAQVKAHNERRYGLAWTPPAPRMRDYIAAVRAIWRTWETGAPLDFHSETYTLTLMTPNFSPKPNGLPPIPISMADRRPGDAAGGRRGVRRRAAASLLDPALPAGSLERAHRRGPGAGQSRAQARRRSWPAASSPPGATLQAVAKMKEYVRFRIAFYCSTRAYWDVLRLHDMEALGEKLNPYPRQNRWDEMAALIPDDIIELFAVVADYANLPRAIEERYGGLADTISLQFSADDDPDELGEMVRAIQRIPSPFQGYANSWS